MKPRGLAGLPRHLIEHPDYSPINHAGKEPNNYLYLYFLFIHKNYKLLCYTKGLHPMNVSSCTVDVVPKMMTEHERKNPVALYILKEVPLFK